MDLWFYFYEFVFDFLESVLYEEYISVDKFFMLGKFLAINILLFQYQIFL